MAITLKLAVRVAVTAMILQRQTYYFDNSMYCRGVFNNKTENAHQKFNQLTEAMVLLNSLVSSIAQQPAPGDTTPSVIASIPMRSNLTGDMASDPDKRS